MKRCSILLYVLMALALSEIVFAYSDYSLMMISRDKSCHGCDLSGANLYGQQLAGANLESADLKKANLTGTSLWGANLSRANLVRADLSGADLSGARLTGADLSWATLSGANFFEANLTQAILEGANLTGVDLMNADLTGANLTAAIIRQTTFCNTKMPDGTINNSGCVVTVSSSSSTTSSTTQTAETTTTQLSSEMKGINERYRKDIKRIRAEISAERKRWVETKDKPPITDVGSAKVWCVHSGGVSFLVPTTCNAWEGKAYGDKYLAKSQHKRLKHEESLGFTKRYCYYPSNKVWYWIGSSSRCPAGEIEVSPEEYYSLWCASKILKEARQMDPKTCGSSAFIGKVFATKSEAENELKNVSIASSTASTSSSTTSTTTQTAQTTTTQPSAVDKSALDLEFWQSVKDQNNADMYRAYIDQFPDGVYVALAKIKLKALGSDTGTVAQSSIPNLDYGDYYALVIGNNKYDHLRNLRTAVNDARAVSSLLEDGYGFKVKRLENATRSDILNSITELRGKVGRKDNVLIYYAGHGVEDKAADEGFWIPTDAKLEEQDNWLSTDRVRKQIKAMPAKHVIVVADSCFSGTILRSSDFTRGLTLERTSPEYQHYLKRIAEDKSRTALTSGGLEPVMDSGGGQHSVFANYFLSILKDNDSVLEAQRLFSELRPKVMANSNQKPEYGTIHLAGDDGGDFLFVRQ